MMQKMSLTVIAYTILAVSIVQAQTFEQNRKVYQEGIAKIEADSKDKNSLDTSYLAALDNLIATYKSEANFDAVKSVMGEKARFSTAMAMGEANPYCKDIQEKYTARLKGLEASKAKQKMDFTQSYIASLRQLMTQAMNANKMDEAEAINNEVKAVEGGGAVLAKQMPEVKQIPSANAAHFEDANAETEQDGVPPQTAGRDWSWKVCDKLVTKRKPEGLEKSAIKFLAPDGNGRAGGNGFIVQAQSGWEGHGTEWNFKYNGKGTCFGFQMIHPFKHGHVLVRVLTYPLRGSKITISSNKPWRAGGWRGVNDVEITELADIKILQSALMGDTPVEIISSLSHKGEYNLYIGGTLAVKADVTDATPLDLSNPDNKRLPHGSGWASTQFRGEGVPMLLEKGQAGVIVAPTDTHTGTASGIILKSAKERKKD